MRFGFILPGGSPTDQLELAMAAERNGWDGVFVWEAGYAVDPWSLLSAMAVRTDRVRLGTMLTPLPWRRPWKLAGQVVTLDQLSGGRAILSVGLGAVDPALGDYGEETDLRRRAELLDDGIDLIDALWSGAARFDGEVHRIDLSQAGAVGARPQPVQSPRVPIWVVGRWPYERSMRRVLRCDGLIPQLGTGPEQTGASPDALHDALAWLADHGGTRPGFDVIWEGETPAADHGAAADLVRPWADAGATWWLESRWSLAGADPQEMRRAVLERLEAGPPALAQRPT